VSNNWAQKEFRAWLPYRSSHYPFLANQKFTVVPNILTCLCGGGAEIETILATWVVQSMQLVVLLVLDTCCAARDVRAVLYCC
jgi:hypothetical protein